MKLETEREALDKESQEAQEVNAPKRVKASREDEAEREKPKQERLVVRLSQVSHPTYRTQWKPHPADQRIFKNLSHV